MATKNRVKVNLTLSRDNYENFKRVARQLGVSASFLMDVLMYSVCKHYRQIESVLREVDNAFLSGLLDDIMQRYGERLKERYSKKENKKE